MMATSYYKLDIETRKSVGKKAAKVINLKFYNHLLQKFTNVCTAFDE